MAIVLRSPARPFTYDDLEEMPEDGYRREIIGGALIVTPSPTGGHQSIIGNLYIILRAAAAADTRVILSPYDWKTPDGGTLVPDLVVIRGQDFDRRGPLGTSAVPLLVVEVLSPSNRAYDRSYKRATYERFGVPSYWIVDPSGPALLALRLVNAAYEIEADVSVGRFASEWPFPVAFDIARLGD